MRQLASRAASSSARAASRIAVVVYGLLAHGMLAGTFTPQTTFPSDDWRSKNPYFQGNTLRQNLAVVERLKALAGRQRISLVQLAVAWVLANPSVQAAIVGAHISSHLEQTAAAAEVHAVTLMRHSSACLLSSLPGQE